MQYKTNNSPNDQYKEIVDDRNYGIFFDDLRTIKNYINKIELPQNLKDRVLKIIM